MTELDLGRAMVMDLWAATGREPHELFHEIEVHGLAGTWAFLLCDIEQRLRASGASPVERPAPLRWATVRDGCCDDWPLACNYHLGWLQGVDAVFYGLGVVVDCETKHEGMTWDDRVLIIERQAVHHYLRSKGSD